MTLLIGNLIVIAACVALMFTPPARRWWRAILLGLRAALVEMPLRAMTGRKRMTEADYRRLRRLEIECGLVEAPPEPKFAYGLTMSEFGERLRQLGGIIGHPTTEASAANGKESRNGTQDQ